MRICIYGAGAMGTSLGLLLKDISAAEFVTRNRERVALLNEQGATVCKIAEHIPVRAILPEEMSGKYSVIFLATKQRENAAVAKYLKGFLSENGVLVSVQNGLPERGLAEIVGAERVYGGTLSWGAEILKDGSVSVSGDGFHIGLGAYGNGQKTAEIARLFGEKAEVTVGNLQELRYAKLSVNAAFSTLSAVSALPFYTVAKKYRRLTLGLLKETFSVARAAGCRKLPLNGHNLFRVFGGIWAAPLLPVAMRKYKETRSGMLNDLYAGRRCDVDFVAGAVIAEGERLGVPTPNLQRSVALVHDIENGLAELSEESLSLLNF